MVDPRVHDVAQEAWSKFQLEEARLAISRRASTVEQLLLSDKRRGLLKRHIGGLIQRG